MGDNASRRGATNLGTPLMIVAFLAIGGFLYWLYQQSELEKALKIQEAAEAAAAEAEAARIEALTIDVEQLQMDAAPYEGDTIRLVDLPIASMLGTQGFWLELPNGNPFLVSLSEAAKADAADLGPGDAPEVIGVVMPMADSVVAGWVEAGTIGEGERLAAEFATHYLEAESVRRMPGGGGEGGAGEGASGGEAGGGS